MKKRIILLLLPGLLLFVNSNVKSQTASFNITYNGFTVPAQTAFQYAADIWANTVVSSVPVKINAHFTPLSAGLLGITFPNGELNFSGAPLADTWYSSALANAISGTELNPGEVDIELYLNSNAGWYYSISGIVPGGLYDLVTVALHEMGHGLGFLSVAKKTGTSGSFGLLQASDFAPLTTSFPWPNLDTLPAIFDRFLVNNLGQPLDTFTNPGNTLGGEFTSQNIFFNGPFAVAANGGIQPSIYAPVSFALGSSITHLDEATYPAGDPNELMTPNGTPGSANHDPGPITLGVLKDIGWNLNPTLGISDYTSNNKVVLYPNPAHDLLAIINFPAKSNFVEITIFDIAGKCLIKNHYLTKDKIIDVSGLMPGFYLISLNTGNETMRNAFVKQ